MIDLGADLFTLGRAAAARARELHGGRAVFARSKRLVGSAHWRGPRDAADVYVEEEDLPKLIDGLLEAAVENVRTFVVQDPAALRDRHAAEMRGLVRVPYRAGEPEAERRTRLEALAALVGGGLAVDGVIPTPEGEPLGLDTLRFVALCRLHLPVPHVVLDFARLGLRLAQMCLGFGADELLGPIVSERALRLGDNAGNPAMTRKEAATLIRGAGLVAYERVNGGGLEAYQWTVASTAHTEVGSPPSLPPPALRAGGGEG
jgi:hypothetical protein